MEAEKLMTVLEVANYLNVPVETIYKWRYAGRGPRAARIGRHLRYRREDVESWFDRQADDARQIG